MVRTRVADVEGAGAVSGTFRQQMLSTSSPIRQRLGVDDVSCDDVIFMDVESTGLGSSPLFLIGVMVWQDDGFQVQQYLARNYAEEAAVVSFFVNACADKKLLITFNGKSFDMPYIRMRAAVHAIKLIEPPVHFDLLHESRRIWKHALPDCKLQTLEKYICFRRREGDIPSSEIPEAYHAFVRTENAYQIAEIIKHNMLDLVTLADIMTRFPKP